MEYIRVKSLHEIKSINSINGRYCLKMCETYMYIQDIMDNKVLVEISLDTNIVFIDDILKSFRLPRIIIEGNMEEKEIEIKQFESSLQSKDALIERQKSYIEELESKLLDIDYGYKVNKVLKAYGTQEILL